MTYRVLIVDDSKLARMAVTRALSELHPEWTRLEAANADEALALAGKERVDMALMDFNMPGRDGLALAAELRGGAPTMPLAVISANQQEEIVKRAHEIGAAFLPKPLTKEALSAFLEAAERRLATGAE